jgi:hypothetical protein
MLILKEPGKTYRLDRDLNEPRSAVLVAAQDVTLDLCGHCVTYGDGRAAAAVEWPAPLPPAFRKSDPPAHADWPDGPTFALREAVGTLTSKPVAVQPGREYAVLVGCRGPDGSALSVAAVNDAGEVLAAGESRNPGRAMDAVAVFRGPPSGRVSLRVMASAPATGPLVIGNVAVVPNRECGVVASPLSAGELPPGLQLPDGHRSVRNFTLRNGRVRQGRGAGRRGAAVFAQGLGGFTLDGVTLEYAGPDTHGVDALWGRDATVTACAVESTSRRVSDRMRLIAGLNFAIFSGGAVIRGNRVGGVPQAGILYNGSAEAGPLVIQSNDVRPAAVVTDGYGILIAGARDFTVDNNTVNPANGRGLLLDGWSRRVATERGVVRDNFLRARERPNPEYGDRLEATALRVRADGDPPGGLFRGLVFERNWCEAHAGAGDVWGAVACRVRMLGNSGSRPDFSHNVFIATATQEGGYGAAALSLGGIDRDTGLTFTRDTLAGNRVGLMLGDNDSWGKWVRGVTLVEPVIRRHGPAAGAFRSVYAGGGETRVEAVVVKDARPQNGAPAAVEYAGDGGRGVTFSAV